MKTIHLLLILGLAQSCTNDSSFAPKQRTLSIGSNHPETTNATTSCDTGVQLNSISAISYNSWVRISWNYSGVCPNDRIILAIENGSTVVDIGGDIPVNSKEYYWRVPQYSTFGNYQNLNLIAMLKSDRTVLSRVTGLNYINCQASSPTPFDATYWVGSNYSFGVDPCLAVNIRTVNIVLEDAITFRKFTIVQNALVGASYNISFPTIPLGVTYRLVFEIPDKPWNNYTLSGTIIVNNANLGNFLTICSANDLNSGDLTSVNWNPDTFVYNQVNIQLYQGVNLVQTWTLVYNSGKFTFGVTAGRNWRIQVTSKYSGFGGYSQPFNVTQPGILPSNYNSDKSNCNVM